MTTMTAAKPHKTRRNWRTERSVINTAPNRSCHDQSRSDPSTGSRHEGGGQLIATSGIPC